jgi:hypothetical protein
MSKLATLLVAAGALALAFVTLSPSAAEAGWRDRGWAPGSYKYVRPRYGWTGPQWGYYGPRVYPPYRHYRPYRRHRAHARGYPYAYYPYWRKRYWRGWY